MDAYQNGVEDKHDSSRAVTDALLAALEKAQQTEDVKYILENKEPIWPRSPSGLSAATAGPMTSASAASTTSWRRTVT